MFKRRVVRNLRAKRDDSDEEYGHARDESSSDPPSIETNVISVAEKLVSKTSSQQDNQIITSASATSLLSFADEDDDGQDVFKVKKSNQSRKLEKMMRRRLKEEANNKESSKSSIASEAAQPPKTTSNVSTTIAKNPAATDTRTNKPTQDKRKANEPLILTGRDAEAIDLAEDDEAKEFRKQLSSAEIPDAKWIHMARKQRQLARDAAEFLPLSAAAAQSQTPAPLDDTQRYKKVPKSRLVREDDENSADDSGEEAGKFYSKTLNDKDDERKQIEADFLNTEQGSEEENDDEFDKWEREQIKKGVSVQQLTSYKQEQIATAYYYQQAASYGAYAPYLAPQLFAAASGAEGAAMAQFYASSAYGLPPSDQSYTQVASEEAIEAQPMDMDIELPTSDETSAQTTPTEGQKMGHLPKIGGKTIEKRPNFDTLKNRIKERHEENVNLINNLSMDLEARQKHVAENLSSMERLQDEQPKLEEKLGFYREMRSYVRDLLDCLDEKVPQIQSLEERAIHLFAGRTNFVTKRRQKDVKDQFDEISKMALGKNQINADPDRMMRSAEREARKTRRRQARERSLAGLAHHDGMSSDDEEAPSRIANYALELEKLISDSTEIFADVIEEYCSVYKIIERFERWRSTDLQSYDQAYGHLCLPKLLAPLVRLQMITWNLSDASLSPPLDTYDWFKCCSRSNIDQSDDQPIDGDPSIKNSAIPNKKTLIASLIEKVICPKLKDFINKIWCPASSTQCQRLCHVIKSSFKSYPQVERKIWDELSDDVYRRIKLSLDEDLFTPIYSKEIVENKSSGASVFLDRQFWFAFKFLKNLTFWENILLPKTLHELMLDGVLNRHLVLNLQCSIATESSTLLKCKSICNTVVSTSWFSAVKKEENMPQLEPFLKIMYRICEQIRDSKLFDRNESNDMMREICRLCQKLRDTKYSNKIIDRFRIRV